MCPLGVAGSAGTRAFGALGQTLLEKTELTSAESPAADFCGLCSTFGLLGRKALSAGPR